mgnify:CR=1 FL=1
MSTLEDVIRLYNDVKAICMFFGASRKFTRQMDPRLDILKKKIRGEMGIASFGDALKRAKDDLGPRSQEEFDNLKDWLATQHPAFAKNPKSTGT